MAIMMTEESNEVTSCRTNDILQGNKSKAPPRDRYIEEYVENIYF